jgi:hypothetical protein
VFPTKDLAELNYGKLKERPKHKVFFLEQPAGKEVKTVELINP